MSVPRLARLIKLAFIFYFLEAGAFLVMSPFSRFWVSRVVVRSPHALREILVSPYFRGFIAGIGLLHIVFALRELEGWRRSGPEEEAPAGERSLTGLRER
jgi:hypothetical protein